MLKNYMKEGQKLPLFGVGPYIIYGIAVVNIIGIVLLCYVLKIGILDEPWTLIFRITGILLIVSGIAIWYIGALRSDMDDSITENRLQTKGIYAWVRNPMYSGWWIALSGITMMWHNVWLLIFYWAYEAADSWNQVYDELLDTMDALQRVRKQL